MASIMLPVRAEEGNQSPSREGAYLIDVGIRGRTGPDQYRLGRTEGRPRWGVEARECPDHPEHPDTNPTQTSKPPSCPSFSMKDTSWKI